MPRPPSPRLIYDARNTTLDVLEEVTQVLDLGADGVVLHVMFTKDGRPVVSGRPLFRFGKSLKSAKSLASGDAQEMYPLEKIMSVLAGVAEIYLDVAEPSRLLGFIKPAWDVYLVTNEPPAAGGPRWVYRLLKPFDVVKAKSAEAVYFDVSGGFPAQSHVNFARSRGLKTMIGPLHSAVEINQAAKLGIGRVVTTKKDLLKGSHTKH